MPIEAEGMSPSFCHWQELTDQYARQLDALRLNEPGAAIALTRTQRKLELGGIEMWWRGATGLHQTPWGIWTSMKVVRT